MFIWDLLSMDIYIWYHLEEYNEIYKNKECSDNVKCMTVPATVDDLDGYPRDGCLRTTTSRNGETRKSAIRMLIQVGHSS